MISANYSTKCQCKIQKGKFWRGNPENVEFQADLIPYGVLSQLQFCYPFYWLSLIPHQRFCVSTEEQAREDVSLDNQRKRISAFCVAKEWTLGRIYADEGISGCSLKRDGVQELISDCK